MKKTLLASIIIVLTVLTLFAEEKEITSFRILTPRTTGMGNSTIALAKGFESLWVNPANFNATSKELNILAVDASIIGNYDELQKIGSMNTGGSSAILTSLKPVIIGSGFGVNGGIGLSWVGKGVGIGLYDSFESYLQGEPFPAGVGGYVDNTMSLMGGYAHPFALTDDITLTAGLSLRPSLKWRLEVDGTMIEAALQDNFDAAAYFTEKTSTPAFGAPIDVGTRVTFPYGLSAALTVRDIFANYRGGSNGYDYKVPMTINFGAAWNPNMKDHKSLIDPTFTLEFSNINGIINKETSVWKEIHLGLELVTLSKALTFWAGIDGGYPALGTGIDLWFIDISMAYGTTEYGRYLGDRPVSNFTVEVSFRID